MTILNFITISTSSKVYKKLSTFIEKSNAVGQDYRKDTTFNQLLGIYQSRIFGICMYRTTHSFTKLIQKLGNLKS